MNKVIIVAPHPDDETLGVGGTLLRHKDMGDELACIFVTGIIPDNGFSKEFVSARSEEIKTVKREYGFDYLYELNLPTTKLSYNDIPTIIQYISDIFNKFNPNIVYLPFYADVHSDHRIIFDAAFSCTKTFRYPSIYKVLMYETLSETDFSRETFSPNYFINISAYFQRKKDLLSIYASQLAKPPFPRSYENVEALARLRGSQAGVIYAEAFRLLKLIEN